MEVTTVNQTVPAVCRVMCTLLTYGISGLNVTKFEGINETVLDLGPGSLPDGYTAYPDIGFAYKVHSEIVPFLEARRRCVEEGAHLARVDSFKKVEYIKQLKRPRNWAWTGILRVYDRTTWIHVGTGLPVTALPWKPDFPRGDGDCVLTEYDKWGTGLGNHPCVDEHNFVCELPIFEEN